MYIFEEMTSKENLKNIKLGLVYFNLVFSSKAKIFINSVNTLYNWFKVIKTIFSYLNTKTPSTMYCVYY